MVGWNACSEHEQEASVDPLRSPATTPFLVYAAACASDASSRSQSCTSGLERTISARLSYVLCSTLASSSLGGVPALTSADADANGRGVPPKRRPLLGVPFLPFFTAAE